MEGGYGDVNLKPNEVGTMRKHYEVVSARAYERLTTSAKFLFKPLYPPFINTMKDESTRVYWKDVVGYEGLYKVSNTGDIFSTLLQRKKKPSTTELGYLVVTLRKDKVSKLVKVHRLVATAFIPNPESKKEVNHKDGNKVNNNVSNLHWCTRKENMKHWANNIAPKGLFSSLGKKGGKARAKNLSKEHLHAIAMKGVEARKAKRNETL